MCRICKQYQTVGHEVPGQNFKAKTGIWDIDGNELEINDLQIKQKKQVETKQTQTETYQTDKALDAVGHDVVDEKVNIKINGLNISNNVCLEVPTKEKTQLNSKYCEKVEGRRNSRLQETRKEAEEMMKHYPNMFAVVVERSQEDKAIPDIHKAKWLIPRQMTSRQLSNIIKEKLNVPRCQNFSLLFNDKSIPSQKSPMSLLNSETYCNEDGFIHITYSSQDCLICKAMNFYSSHMKPSK